MATRFLRISVLWFLACVLLGTYMGATHQFGDREVHVHGNLLGWLSCAIFALVHRSWPALSSSRLGSAHFWLHNCGLVMFIAGLAMLPRNDQVAGALLGIGSIVISAATACFLALVWRTNLCDTGNSARMAVTTR